MLGAATVVVGLSTSLALTIPALLLAGAAWVLALSMLNTVVQLSAPRWVVGRAMAAIQMVIFGGFAAAGLSCGARAQVRGVPFALAISGIGLAGSTLLGLWLPVATPDTADSVSPAQTRAPDGRPVDPRSGPVVTTVQYRVAKEQASEFVSRIWELRAIRRIIPAVEGGARDAERLQRAARRQVGLLDDPDDLQLLGCGVSHSSSPPFAIMLF